MQVITPEGNIVYKYFFRIIILLLGVAFTVRNIVVTLYFYKSNPMINIAK